MFALLANVVAQDPAHGWMAYAVGTMPHGERITRLEMTWMVGAAPRRSNAFFSPWFGMDPSDNLNLVQPVNPWSGSSWSMYTEYFQWSPTHNSNSRQHSVEAGQTLHGQLYYIESQDAYVLNQTVVETGASSSQVVPCQSGKKYTVPYVVYEKTWPCGDYPPDGKVSFNIVASECDGAPCDITWEAKVKDPNCNMQAVIGTNQIDLTWDTSAKSKYDGMSRDELAQLNARGAWAAALAQPVERASE